MKATLANVGARGVDSLPFSQGGSASEAKALKASGIDFFVGYLGAVTPAILKAVLDAGLAFMPVTFGNAWNGPATVAMCKALGLPKGITVWLDVEGLSAYNMDPSELRKKINAWADEVIKAGFQPGIYVGCPQPLNSFELFSLKVVRYWQGLGRTVDKTGALAEPDCGWCMTQCYPSIHWAGVWVDVNFIGQDYRGRLPTWAVKD